MKALNPGPLSGRLEIRFPKYTYRSTRGTKTLYFAVERGVGIVVNEAGSEVLDACRSSGTVSEIAKKLVAGQESIAPIIEEAIKPFLDKLILQGFLHTGGYVTPPRQSGSIEAVPNQLNTVYLHVTDECNLRCVYCYNAQHRSQNLELRGDNRARTLTSVEIRRLITDVSELGVSTFILTGGEPLLRKDLCALASYAKAHGLSTTLLTNAALINERRAQEIACSFDTVIASLDSFDDEESKLLRPGASLKQVSDGIRRLSKAGLKSLAMRPVVSTVNIGSLRQYARTAANEFGCTRFSIAACLPNSAEELEVLDIFPDPKQYSDAISVFYDELKSIGGATVKQELPLEGSGSCGAGINILSIATNGDVYPCQSLHFDKFLLGNIRKNRISEIFGESASKWEQREKNFPRFGPCLQCEMESICASKCHVYQNLFEGHEALFFSRMCPFFKSELDLKLWREVERKENLQY